MVWQHLTMLTCRDIFTDKEYEVGTVMVIGGDETTEYDKTKSAFGVNLKTRF